MSYTLLQTVIINADGEITLFHNDHFNHEKVELWAEQNRHHSPEWNNFLQQEKSTNLVGEPTILYGGAGHIIVTKHPGQSSTIDRMGTKYYHPIEFKIWAVVSSEDLGDGGRELQIKNIADFHPKKKDNKV